MANTHIMKEVVIVPALEGMKNGGVDYS
jgi:hypothetical protein